MPNTLGDRAGRLFVLEATYVPTGSKLEGFQARLNPKRHKKPRARPSPKLAPASSRQVQKQVRRQERDERAREPKPVKGRGEGGASTWVG